MGNTGSFQDDTPRAAPPDDLQLLSAVTRGDERAFKTIHQRHVVKLTTFAHRVTGDRGAAEEVANDTFLVIWRSSASFQKRSKVSTWMFAIAYRIAKKKRQKLALRQRDLDIDECAVSDTQDMAALTIQRRDILKALDRLKPELRAVIELTYFQGYLYSEIAEMLGCPVGTVKTRILRAKEQLRHLLREDPAPLPLRSAA
ncbi:MAG: RNA polymerase sigma factor [Pseudomonadota bacterium]